MHSEIVHDWAPYNRWVDKVSDNVGSSNPPRVIPTDWWTVSKAVALCVLAVGTAAALMLWASRDPKVVVPEIKVDVQQPHTAAPLPPTIVNSAEAPTDTNKLIRNFVLFTERHVPGIGVVMTGWEFDTQNNPRPVKQWCYLTPQYGSEVGVVPHIDLPRSSAAIASGAVLSRHKLTSANVEKARQNCVWFLG